MTNPYTNDASKGLLVYEFSKFVVTNILIFEIGFDSSKIPPPNFAIQHRNVTFQESE